MKKSCTITYGEALEKSFSVIDIEGIISLCGVYGTAFAKPINLILNTISLSQQSKDLQLQYIDDQMEFNKGYMSNEEFNIRKKQYEASQALVDMMIRLQSKGYNAGTIMDEIITDYVHDAVDYKLLYKYLYIRIIRYIFLFTYY